MLLNTRVILCNKLKMIDRNHVTITDMEQKKFKFDDTELPKIKTKL
jgi:hypothetical protein